MDFLSTFDGFDYAILIVLFLSIILGTIRGFFKECLVLIFFVLTLWLAYLYTPALSHHFDEYINSEPFKYWLTFVLFSFSAWILSIIIITLVTKTIKFTPHKAVDKPLGAVAGFLRGILVVSLLVVVGTNTSWAEKDWWKASVTRPYFSPISDKIDSILPTFDEEKTE